MDTAQDLEGVARAHAFQLHRRPRVATVRCIAPTQIISSPHHLDQYVTRLPCVVRLVDRPLAVGLFHPVDRPLVVILVVALEWDWAILLATVLMAVLDVDHVLHNVRLFILAVIVNDHTQGRVRAVEFYVSLYYVLIKNPILKKMSTEVKTCQAKVDSAGGNAFILVEEIATAVDLLKKQDPNTLDKKVRQGIITDLQDCIEMLKDGLVHIDIPIFWVAQCVGKYAYVSYWIRTKATKMLEDYLIAAYDGGELPGDDAHTIVGQTYQTEFKELLAKDHFRHELDISWYRGTESYDLTDKLVTDFKVVQKRLKDGNECYMHAMLSLKK